MNQTYETAEIVRVVLEVKNLPDGGYRVFLMGVFRVGEELPPKVHDHRNVIDVWPGMTVNFPSFKLTP